MADKHITISRTKQGYTCEVYDGNLAESRRTLTSAHGEEHYSFADLIRVLSHPSCIQEYTYAGNPELRFRRTPIKIPEPEREAIKDLVGRLKDISGSSKRKEDAIKAARSILSRDVY